jgi:ferredoxin-thioredoxin reductase catalytic subunit
MKLKVTDDGELNYLVTEGLLRNKFLYGKRYCPCKLDRTDDTVCPCKEFRETKHCHCGIFSVEE